MEGKQKIRSEMETKNPCLARLNPAILNTLNTYII